ncbi:MAG: hypothetical protein WCI74_13180, partial [Actinomycetes bacterium]
DKKSNKDKGTGKSARSAHAAVRPGVLPSSRIDLRVAVPADLRRMLRSGAKARGTSVDGVVDSVLSGWK